MYVPDGRAAEERRIFAGDNGCALGDRQRLFGIVLIDGKRVREVVEGERIVGAVGQDRAVLRDRRSLSPARSSIGASSRRAGMNRGSAAIAASSASTGARRVAAEGARLEPA